MSQLLAHPYLITVALLVLGVGVSTIVSTFEDPDHDPSTPPPKWVVPFIVLQRVLTIVAPQGTVGIGGSKYSIPLVHYPKPADTPPGASGKVPAFVALALLPLLASCAFCNLPENRMKAQCVALRVVTNCAAPEVLKIVTDIAATVGAALGSGDYSHLLDNVVLDLQHRGVTDAWGVVTCAIGQFKNRGGLQADRATALHAEEWMSSHPAKVDNYGFIP